MGSLDIIEHQRHYTQGICNPSKRKSQHLVNDTKISLRMQVAPQTMEHKPRSPTFTIIQHKFNLGERTKRELQMNGLSSRNNRLELKTLGKTAHHLRGFHRIYLKVMKKTTKRSKHVTGWAQKHQDCGRLCPKVFPDIAKVVAFVLLQCKRRFLELVLGPFAKS